MSISAWAGPLVSFGQSPYAADYNPEAGPSLLYSGAGILDPRPYYTYIPGQNFGAFTPGFLGFDNVTTINAVPYTASNVAIVASANPSSATLSLVTANSATTGVSIVPSVTNASTGAVDTNGGAGLVMLDGFTSFTGSISGSTLTVTANSTAPICIGMTLLTAGGSGTLPAGLTVIGYGTGTGYTGTYVLSGTATVGSGTITANFQTISSCAVPFGSAGTIALWNPQALVGRAVSITAAAQATYTTATITGYDIYGFPMTQALTISAGSTVTGTKAFKYIKSVVLSGGTADTSHAYSVGTADVFGFPLRSDTFGDVTINYAGSLTATTLITSAANYTAAVTTAPSSTTGDVRGTFASTSATGTNRFVFRQSPQPYNVGSITGLFGNTQA